MVSFPGCHTGGRDFSTRPRYDPLICRNRLEVEHDKAGAQRLVEKLSQPGRDAASNVGLG